MLPILHLPILSQNFIMPHFITIILFTPIIIVVSSSCMLILTLILKRVNYFVCSVLRLFGLIFVTEDEDSLVHY